MSDAGRPVDFILFAPEYRASGVLLHVSSLPSPYGILAADFARLGEQVTQAEQAGADRIHVDVMDGHFVQK